jgi:hypothetical protein
VGGLMFATFLTQEPVDEVAHQLAPCVVRIRFNLAQGCGPVYGSGA